MCMGKYCDTSGITLAVTHNSDSQQGLMNKYYVCKNDFKDCKRYSGFIKMLAGPKMQVQKRNENVFLDKVSLHGTY